MSMFFKRIGGKTDTNNRIEELEHHIIEWLCGIDNSYFRLMTTQEILNKITSIYNTDMTASKRFKKYFGQTLEQVLQRMQSTHKIRLYKEAETFEDEVYGSFDISRIRERENQRNKSKSAAMDRILVHGFVREMEEEYDLFCLVGADVINLLILFTLKLYRAYAKGLQTVGELGLGHDSELYDWTELESFSEYISGTDLEHIYLGKQRFSLLDVRHNIYGVGSNMNGDCGVSSTKYGIFEWCPITQYQVYNKANAVPYLQQSDELELEIRMLSNGLSAYHTFICTKDDRMFVYGNLKANQAGRSRLLDDLNPVQTRLLDGNLKANQKYSIHPVEITHQFSKIIQNKERIVQMECGRFNSLFLTNRGMVYGLGRTFEVERQSRISGRHFVKNETPKKIEFQQEQGSNDSKSRNPVIITKISCGFEHCLALTNDGQVYAWGYNMTKGQLGLVPLPQYKTSEDRWNYKYSVYKPVLNTHLSNIISITCGYNDSLCIDGMLMCHVFGSTAFKVFKIELNPSHPYGGGHRNERNLRAYYKPYTFGKEFIKDGCCGFNHTALLTVNNELVLIGAGRSQTLTNKDIGLQSNQIIEKVVAGYENTIVITT
eukprot:678415_1